MRKTKLELLLLLANEGALSRGIGISTTGLSKRLGGSKDGASQQTVSRWLSELEGCGYVERKGRSVRICPKGKGKIEEVAAMASGSLSGKRAGAAGTCEISGKVMTGFREGRYYVSLPEYKRQLTQKLGFDPFAGTLNIKLADQSDIESVRRLKASGGLQTKEFVRDGRSFGSSKCFPVLILGKIRGALVFPERSHYGDDVVEVIAPVSLRKKLGLSDGSEVSLRVL
jgi:riboflavin kinase